MDLGALKVVLILEISKNLLFILPSTINQMWRDGYKIFW